MSRNVTLLQLRTDVAELVDALISTTGRYTPTLLNRLINQAVQRFREKMSAEGVQRYLTATSGTLSAGATTPHAFAFLDLASVSPSVVRTFNVHVKVDGVTRTLSQVDFALHDQYGGPLTTGEPSGFSPYQGGLAIFPPPSQAYPYVLYYLPVLPDLAADGDTFDGTAGWEEWVTWDVVVKLLVRDNYPTQYQLAVQTRDQVQADVMRNATRVTSSGGASVGRDSLGRRLSGQGRVPRLPPP